MYWNFIEILEPSLNHWTPLILLFQENSAYNSKTMSWIETSKKSSQLCWSLEWHFKSSWSITLRRKITKVIISLKIKIHDKGNGLEWKTIKGPQGISNYPFSQSRRTEFYTLTGILFFFNKQGIKLLPNKLPLHRLIVLVIWN